MNALSPLAAAVLAGGLLAAATPPSLAATVPATAAPGIITTVAGGPGHGPARTVSQYPQSVATGPGGTVYLADGEGTVRAFSPATLWERAVAGAGVNGPYGGDGGPATATLMGFPGGAVTDGAGNVLIANAGSDRVLAVPASTGTFYGLPMVKGHMYTIAGNGTIGYSGDGGPATQAALQDPDGLALDAAGNVLAADRDNDRVRMVAVTSGTFFGQAMTAGDIYTVAGDGEEGFSGDGGPATSAALAGPGAVALDAAGNLLIADTFSNRVRVVAATTRTFYGRLMTAGDIYTVAGDGTAGFSGDGGPATSAELNVPRGLAFDAHHNLLIADSRNDRVRVVAASSGTFYGQAMTRGGIYTVAGDGTRGYGGDHGPAGSAVLNTPGGVAPDAAGNLLIADTENFRVRLVAAHNGTFYGVSMVKGDIYTVAGNGRLQSSGDRGPALAAEISQPSATAVSTAGNIVIAETPGNRVRVAAGSTGTFYGKAMTAGHIYTIAGTGVAGYGGDGGPGGLAQLSAPNGVAVDPAGNAVIADSANFRVRVVAGRTGTFYGKPMTAGHIYTIAGNGKPGFYGDGLPATLAKIKFSFGVAVDAAGDVVIADTGNHRIRVVAGHTGTLFGRAVLAGRIYTVAGTGKYAYSGDGGPGTSAELRDPRGPAADTAGNVVFSDFGNDRIRLVAAVSGTFYGQAMTAGDIYTVAGNGVRGFAGDGGPAASAEFFLPGGVAVDGAGDLVIADTANSRVRVVAAASGTFYGVPMTGGDIYTVAGDDSFGSLSGDGGPATAAALNNPGGVSASPAGGIVIADTANSRIRQVTG
jgi:NHL repeat-containing protein